MAAVKSGLETLRDYAIVEFLANRGPSKKEISKTDDALFKRLTKLFEEAGLSCEPLDYMKSAPNFWDRQNQLNADTKGNLKTKVKTSFAAMQSVLQLCGFNATTVEDVFSAIGTIKRNARVAAATASVAPVASTVATVTEDATVRMAPSPLAPVLEAPLVLESAMTASAPADILPTVVETPQLPRRHKRVVPMCANNSQITTFFAVAPAGDS